MNRLATLAVVAALLPTSAFAVWPFGAQSDAQPSQEDQMRQQKEREALRAEAAKLIPQVIDQQAGRLAKFRAQHAADVAAWKFHCERYGDFLSVQMSSRRAYDGKVEKTVLAINLNEANSPQIKFVEGSLPDLKGIDAFYESDVQYEGDKNWTAVPQINSADIDAAVDGGRKRVSWGGVFGGGGSSGGGSGPPPLTDPISGIAQAGADDLIVFGDGGGMTDPWAGCTGGCVI